MNIILATFSTLMVLIFTRTNFFEVIFMNCPKFEKLNPHEKFDNHQVVKIILVKFFIKYIFLPFLLSSLLGSKSNINNVY